MAGGEEGSHGALYVGLLDRRAARPLLITLAAAPTPHTRSTAAATADATAALVAVHLRRSAATTRATATPGREPRSGPADRNEFVARNGAQAKEQHRCIDDDDDGSGVAGVGAAADAVRVLPAVRGGGAGVRGGQLDQGHGIPAAGLIFGLNTAT